MGVIPAFAEWGRGLCGCAAEPKGISIRAQRSAPQLGHADSWLLRHLHLRPDAAPSPRPVLRQLPGLVSLAGLALGLDEKKADMLRCFMPLWLPASGVLFPMAKPVVTDQSCVVSCWWA